MRRNPFAKLLKRNPLKQAADDYLRSVKEAQRMEADGTAPEMPTHLSEGMYAGVAIREVPSWFLESLTEKGPLPYALGEAVCGELLRRRLGVETLTLQDTLQHALTITRKAAAIQNNVDQNHTNEKKIDKEKRG